ncbi:MAG: hypothetical protein WD491_04640 [Balneolales bacterium]
MIELLIMGIKIINSIFLLLSFAFIVTFLPDHDVRAQLLTDSGNFHFGNSQLGARSSALANTQDAYSLEGIYRNPAAFLFSPSSTSMMANTFYSHTYDIAVENVIGVINRSENNLITVGATLQHNGLSQIYSGSQDFPLNFTQYGLSASYAVAVLPSFSIGAGASGSYGTTGDDSNWTLASNFGVYYTPTSSLSYGISYSGLGSGLEHLGDGLLYVSSDKPTTDKHRTDLLLNKMPHRLEIGATMRFPTISREPDFSLSFANEKIFGESGMVYKAGLEIYPGNHMALRGGYIHSPFADGVRLGFGLFLGKLTVDYAFSQAIVGLEGNSHLLGLSLGFASTN